jgi:hypothetical protein
MVDFVQFKVESHWGGQGKTIRIRKPVKKALGQRARLGIESWPADLHKRLAMLM